MTVKIDIMAKIPIEIPKRDKIDLNLFEDKALNANFKVSEKILNTDIRYFFKYNFYFYFFKQKKIVFDYSNFYIYKKEKFE